MPAPSPHDRVWASWVRGDAAGAITVALQHATDERMLRAACAMALRSHRVDLLTAHIDDISALDPGMERDGVVASVLVGEGRIDEAASVVLAISPDEGAATDDDKPIASAASLRSAAIAYVALGAIASGAWVVAARCLAAVRATLEAEPDDAAEEIGRFDILGMAAMIEAHTGTENEAVVALESALAPLRSRNLLSGEHALALIALGDVNHLHGSLERAAVNLSRGARLTAASRPGFISHARVLLAFIRIRQGRWADAAVEVERLGEPNETIERDWIRTQILAVRGLLRVVTGDLDAGTADLREARALAETTPSNLAAMVLLHARIVEAVTRGDWDGLQHALDDSEEPGYRHPYRDGEWRVLTLVAAWNRRSFADFRRRLTDWALTSDAVDDPYYWACASLAAEFEQRHSDALAAAERALTVLGPAQDPMGQVWVRMVVGRYFVRYGDAGSPDPDRAREVWDHVIAQLRGLGALALADRCERIVERMMARFERDRGAHPLASLTPQQVRIARAVAQGYTSDEIAAIEFLSKRTIDYHVTNIVVRLGLSSRREIARVIDAAD